MHGPGALALLINIRGCRDKVFGECSLACACVPLHVLFLSFFACVAHRETSQVNMSGFLQKREISANKNLPESILPPIGGNIKPAPDVKYFHHKHPPTAKRPSRIQLVEIVKRVKWHLAQEVHHHSEQADDLK